MKQRKQISSWGETINEGGDQKDGKKQNKGDKGNNKSKGKGGKLPKEVTRQEGEITMESCETS